MIRYIARGTLIQHGVTYVGPGICCSCYKFCGGFVHTSRSTTSVMLQSVMLLHNSPSHIVHNGPLHSEPRQPQEEASCHLKRPSVSNLSLPLCLLHTLLCLHMAEKNPFFLYPSYSSCGSLFGGLNSYSALFPSTQACI